MADFSIGDALGAGFGLIRRRPVSVLVWGLIYGLLGMALPIGLVFWTMAPDLLSLASSFHPGQIPGAAAPENLPVLQAKMMLLQPVMVLDPLILQSILAGAVFRAVLEPGSRSWAYLRLGRRELWVGLTLMVAVILAIAVMMLMEIAGLAVGLALNLAFDAQHLAWPIRIAAFVALGLGLLAGFMAIAVRFSLGPPMSFAEGQFRLFESWELTRGHGWKLFGLGLLTALVSLALIILLQGLAVAAVVLGGAASHLDAAAWAQLAQHPEALGQSGLEAGLVAGVVILSLGMGAVLAITLAPWAVAYRELLPAARPEPREGGLYEPAPAPPTRPAESMTGPPGPDEHGHADPHAGLSDAGRSGSHEDGD